ncbi:MAG: hypothetical protein LBR53_09430 [Deltaproteobacteria bacterium]|jgi:tetratricopeptide (TPR) repeat protein|nr:hypothetical protein [Deltaproteobacteria bacterium]
MSLLLDTAARLRTALEEAALSLLGPGSRLGPEDAPPWETGEGMKKGLAGALELFGELVRAKGKNPGSLQEAGLSAGILSRAAFNLSDCLARSGMTLEALQATELLEEAFPMEEAILPKLLNRLNLVLLALPRGDFLGALEQCENLRRLGDRPEMWRALAEAAFFLCAAALKESALSTAEDLYSSFLENRESVLSSPARGIREISLAAKLERELSLNRRPLPERPPSEEDFPLGMSSKGEKFLSFFHFHELQAPLPEESAADIISRVGTLLTVWHGEHRSMEEALKRFDSIVLWGRSGVPALERARSATYLIFYLGPDYRAAEAIYRKVFGSGENASDPRISLEKARCAINLVFSSGASGDIEAASGYFAELSSMRDSLGDPSLYAKAALNLVTALASKGRAVEAGEVYQSVPDWGSAWEDKLVRLKALRCLVHYYGLAGDLEEAWKLFRSIDLWGGEDERWVLKSRAAVYFIEILEKRGELRAAAELFSSMRWKKGYLEEDINRAVAARSLVNLHLSAGDFRSAVEVYRSLSPREVNERLDLERGRLAVNLILELGKAGKLRQARYVYNTMESFSRTRELELLQAKAAVNLVAACEAAGDAKKAQAIYDSLKYAEDLPAFSREKAKAAVTLVGLYGKLGQPRKGRDLYLAMPDFSDPEYRYLKSSAGVNLVTAFAMAERWAEALESATEVVNNGLSEDMRGDLLKKLNFIMSRTVNYGKSNLQNILGLFSNN